MKTPLIEKLPLDPVNPDDRGMRRPSTDRGFAMIVVLTMMVLITLVALGLISLSSISLRVASSDQAMATARANARMSLALAIAELQKELGPDQRISASAAVLDSAPETPGADGVAQEHLLGVWNSHTEWLNHASIQSTYAKGREPRFRRWLVSGEEPSALEKLSYAKSQGGEVEMVGEASSRNGTAARAGKVRTEKGALAWWIGGENEKADLSLVDPEAGDTAARVVAQGNAMRSGIEQVEGWKKFSMDEKKSGRLVSASTGGLVLPAGEGRESSRRSFHDVTAGSFGVLANVRKGGLKQDLNSALESETLPAALVTAPIRSEDPATVPTPQFPTNLNFPSWNQLREYYGLQSGRSEGGGLEKKPQPTVSYYWPPGNLNATGYSRTPVTTRVMLILTAERTAGTNPGTFKYKMGVTPVVVLWNPYSAQLKCQPVQFTVFPYNLEYKLYTNNVAGSWTQLNTGSAVAKTSGTMTLEPGETRIFSPTGAGGTLAPGFRSPSTAAGIEITPTELAQDQPATQNFEMAIRLSDVLGNSANGGKFQIYWTVANANATGDRFNELAANPCETGQPLTIVSDSPGERFSLSSVGGGRVNMANFQFILKSGADLRNTGYYKEQDLRCKNFIHANPARNRAMIGSGDPEVKRYAQYMVWSQDGTGNALNPDWETATNRAYFGNGITAGQGQTVVPLLDLSPVPVTSLAMFQNFTLGTGKSDWGSGRHNFEVAANQALGIGNSFAHPMITGESVYSNVPKAAGLDTGSVNQFGLIVDQWDRGFLCNDALWDDWFCSGIASQANSSLGGSLTPAKQVDGFLAGTGTLGNPRLMYVQNKGGELPADARKRLVQGAAPAANAWKEAARYMLVRGAFNVNSTSVEAWKAFLASSCGGNVTTSTGSAAVPKDSVLISRFGIPPVAEEGAGPQDAAAWKGVRYLTPEQIDRLARECVHQVKLRGPFLNLSDFVNRRLARNETGVCGALQAAIDWDEFGGRTPEPGNRESINGRFKQSDAYIKAGTVGSVNFPQAGAGSRYTGIPGYVTQADILKRVGNGITVRDDTFRIRSYGEAHDAKGVVIARVWCEAVVQRLPQYVDPKDDPEVPTAALTSSLNKTFGRAFSVVSFRWLSGRSEI